MNKLHNSYKKVLFISYPFPPLGAAGALRPFRFVKNLPLFNWLPIVLTIKERKDVPHDYSLIRQLKDEVIIHRTRTFFPAHILSKIKSITPLITSKNKEGKPIEQNSNTLNNIQKNNSKLKLFLMSLITTPDHHVFWLPFGLIKSAEIIKKKILE